MFLQEVLLQETLQECCELYKHEGFNVITERNVSAQSESVEWLHRQGHNVVSLKGNLLYDQAPGIYQVFPYHTLIDFSSDDLHEFFHQSNTLALRYSSPLQSKQGKLSYHVVCTQKNYNFASLSKKPRRDVKIGLEYASYEPIPISRLAHEGWSLRFETLVRQGRTKAESREMWEALCTSADGLPGFAAWGALHDGRLVTALLSHKSQDTVSILYQQSLTDHLKFGVNNALTYVFTHEMMQQPDVHCVFYGIESLDAPPSIDEYKFRMGYSAKPVRQRVVFNPYLTPFVGKASYLFLKLASRWTPLPLLTKGEGMLRFYLEGKRSLPEQTWPEVLINQRESILAS